MGGLLFLLLTGFAASFANDLLSKAEEEKSVIYSPLGKRDPFKQPALEDSTRELASINALERYSIGQFQLRAVLRVGGVTKAMFEGPDGHSYVVHEGEVLGRERGTISRILNTAVIVTEKTANYMGTESLYERVISLPEE